MLFGTIAATDEPVERQT